MILATFWREIVIAALLAALALTGKLYTGKVGELAAAQAEHQTWMAAAAAERLAIEARSNRAIEILKAEHEANKREVEKNAWINFKRRFPNLDCRVPSPSAMPGAREPDAPDGAGSLNAASEEPMAHFVTACASDAATIAEFQRWVRLNRIPVEGE